MDMKAADVRAMTLDQLDDEVLKLKKEQFNLRFQRATGQLENTSRVRIVRRVGRSGLMGGSGSKHVQGPTVHRRP